MALSEDNPIKKLYSAFVVIQTPPLPEEVRREIGYLLWQLQRGRKLSLPHSRPMPSIGKGCHELRVNDKNTTWRAMYYIDTRHDRIVVLEIFQKKTNKTPQKALTLCKNRLAVYKESWKE